MSERSPLPEALTRPEPGRVLAVVPHPDDDVIGIGGTLCLHAEQGDAVHVVIAFDGLEGDPDRHYDPDDYREMRRKEALAAGALLGLTDYEFWGYPEGHLPADHQLVAAARRCAEVVTAIRPDVVYAPWVGEYHLDHHVLARVARMGLALADFEGSAWGFEVWTPLIPTRIVDITSVRDRKVSALAEHKSQIAYRDLQEKMLGFTAQRAMYLSTEATHGEAFAPLGEPSDADHELLD